MLSPDDDDDDDDLKFLDAPYQNEGECHIEGADSANIPVDIWLDAPPEPGDRWTLRASNYMPRRGRVHAGAYLVTADNREVLVALVQQYITPLYEAAVNTLKKMEPDEDGCVCLYYWNKAGD